ncbi:MgtC/SapB family protein [Saccharopolyspora sp. NPDC000995]
MDTTTALVHFATALAIGLLLGLEREHSTAGQEMRPAGSRTFSLLGIAGAIAAALGPAVLIATISAASLLVIAWYFLTARASAEADVGATTEVAAIATVLLGALAWTRPTWAVPIAVAMVALLAAKRPLHRFATRLVTDDDIADAIRLFVVAFVIYPLLPDKPMGPYGALNPSRIWLLVIAITVIGWAGYVAVRALGERHGLLIVGFLGGFVSASATTVVLARRSDRGVQAVVLPAVLAASVATLVQLIALTAVANPAVSIRLLPASLAGAAVLLAESGWLTWRARRTGEGHDSARPANADAKPSAFQRPLSLRVTLSLTVLLVLLLLATRAAADLLGPQGVIAAAFVGGLADTHTAAVAAASLGGTVVPTSVAVLGVGAALLSNTMIKLVLAAAAGGMRFALRLAALLVLPAATVAAGFTLAL